MEDELENKWGTNIYHVDVPNNRVAHKSKEDLDRLMKKAVPGFKLHKVQSAGTYSNMVAIQTLCNYNVSTCLIGLGSYVGGDDMLQDLSSSMYDAAACIAVPKYVENANPMCFNQTIPLPYHIPGGICEEELLELEADCLRCLHKKIIMQVLSCRPRFCGLLLELVQGGNGTTLSDQFLIQLGSLCKQQSIGIIVDEILTGGRCGRNNQLVLTLSTPPAFQEVVEFITMGKFMKCALVLRKMKSQPRETEEKLRGTSTELDCAIPYAVISRLLKDLKAGLVQQRQKEVLQYFKIPEGSDKVWGYGLLLFSTYKRPMTMTALKNRMLPMLECGTKVRKQRAITSIYTRKYVTDQIVECHREWIIAHSQSYDQAHETCFLSALVDKLYQDGQRLLQKKGMEEEGFFRIRPKDVVDFIGANKAEQLAIQCRSLLVKEGTGKSSRKALKFVQDAILQACKKSFPDGTRIVYKKKKTAARTEFTFVSAKLFGVLDSDGKFQFSS